MFSENSADLQLTNSEPQAVNGQISQIPGLSPNLTALSVEKFRGRRTGVLESDSDYIKLAKQGGHKGLLWHEEKITPTANSYKPPDWFLTCAPSLINSEEKKNPGAFQPLEPPFGTDNMSAWERSDRNGTGKGEDNIDHSQVANAQSSNQYHQTSKFKRRAFDKNASPVNMSKLLSFGYAEDTDLSN